MVKRVLTIQDISCVGQCSLTVALPVLAACGVESAVLPTTVLSTHTGGFGTPAVHSLEEFVSEAENHWRLAGLKFNAILTGYLGKITFADKVLRLTKHCTVDGAKLIVDPAMADHGRYYTGLDEHYGDAMAELCRRADYILPNITEACLLTGTPYRENAGEAFAEELAVKLRSRFPAAVVLTGVGYSPEETGVILWDAEGLFRYRHPRLPNNYPGTGDAFSAAFAGLMTRGLSPREAVMGAADFVVACIAETDADPDHWYGIHFGPRLYRLMPGMVPGVEQ